MNYQFSFSNKYNFYIFRELIKLKNQFSFNFKLMFYSKIKMKTGFSLRTKSINTNLKNESFNIDLSIPAFSMHSHV